MISNLPSNFASTVTPYALPGRQPVSQENPEARNTPLKPVEQSADSASLQNRRDPADRPTEQAQRELQRQQTRSLLAERRQQTSSQQQVNKSADQQGAQEVAAEADEQQLATTLAARDREVRAHERAHASAGGSLTGSPQYDYEQGPDGTRYAVSGEVPITLTAVENDPQATLELARMARDAALAPEQPSQQDLQIAARASQLEIQAQQDLAQQSRQELRLQTREQELNRLALQQEQALREAQRKETSSERDATEQGRIAAERQQASDDASAQEAQDRLDKINQRAQELNRRILAIGEARPTPDIGYLLDQVV